MALLAKLLIEMLGIDDVAVVGDGDGVGALTDNEGLDVGDAIGASGGIAVVTYSEVTAELA